MKIYLTAIIKSKAQFLDQVKLVLENMVTETRKESACIQYDLHQGISDNNLFVFYEIWESQGALDSHNNQPYILEFKKLSDNGYIESVETFLTSKCN